jgi:NADH:ubiquinone oxidoreductase subunit K
MELILSKIYVTILTLEKFLSVNEKKNLILASFFLCLFFIIWIINFSIILWLDINIFHFLLCLEIFYLNIILFSIVSGYLLTFPLCTIFALFILIFAAIETVLGLSLLLINKQILQTINLKFYNNNRF